MTISLTPDEVQRWRSRFPILDRCTYLINNSLGAMPVTVPDALAEYAALWGTKGVEAWHEDWLPEVERVSDLLAALLGAPSGSVVVHQNVATLTAMVMSALPSGRKRVVLSDLEWPSHRYLLERWGLDVTVIPSDGVHLDTQQLVDAIDPRTLLVPISHVTFRSSHINDVAAVSSRAREVGAVSLVDGYHAVGHMPVDVRAIGCDFYVGGSVKWLCGGPGVAYLYVAPETELAPRDVGWLGHARPFSFDDGWEPAEGAASWLGGTPSMPALYAAREGYRIIADVGPDRIRATSMELSARLVEGAHARGLVVRTPVDPKRRAGTVTIDLGDRTEAVARDLIRQGIVVDYRPRAGIRVGPHFFNTPEECDRLLGALLAAG